MIPRSRFLCLLAAPALLAQEPVERTTRFCSAKILASGAGSESLGIEPNDTANPCVLDWTAFYPSEVHVTQSLPFHRVGSLEKLAPDVYLICGKATDGRGVLVRARLVRTPKRDIRLDLTAHYTGLDSYAAAWSGTHLVVLDFTARKILGAPWDGTSAFPAGPAFVEIANSISLPALGDPAFLELEGGSGCVFLSNRGRRVRRFHHDGAWQTRSHALADEPHPWPYRVESMATVRSVGPVTIRGDAGNFSVVDVSSATTVGAGSIASNGGSLVWMPTTEMIPGNPHRVEGTSGGVASGTFEPLVRHGRPSIATALRAHEGHVDPEKVFVGSTDSMPATRVGELNPVPTADETLPAALWASIRSVDGSDPVVFVGEQALIDALPFALGFTITARAGAKTAAVACPLPIPDDPALAGTVLILQFGVERRGEVVISDVFGTTIRDAPGAHLAAGPRPRGARAWTSRSGAERTAIVAAAVAWLGHSTRTRAETGRRLYEAVRKR